MEDKEKEEVSVNEAPMSRKDTFRQRFKTRYPDLPDDDEEEFYGKLGEEFDRFDRSDKAQKELGDLLASDPRSAGFLMVLRQGGNPMEFLIEQYGDDFRDALNDEEKAKELSEAFSKYAEKQAKNKELQSQAEANMQAMLDELDAAQAEGKFTDEDAANAYEYLYGDGGLLDRIITNNITKDDWLMLMKASNYDKAQAEAAAREEEARSEGMIAGRNAKIDEAKRKRTKVENMPSDLGASGGGGAAAKKVNGALEALDNIQRNRKSVFED